MKRFIIKVLALLAVSSLLIGGYCQLATLATAKYNGANTADQIKMSFSNAVRMDYNCYFLGNSRIYRDINPDMFDSVSAYNFGHDNDSYNQMYYKLLYLIDHNKPIEYLIVGTDYFQFSFLSDTRNYIYSALFPREYQADYEKKSWIEIKEEYYTTLWSNKQNARMSCLSLLLNKDAPEHVNFQKQNGQYVAYGTVNPNDTVDRSYEILDVQLDYFRKIIALCEEKGIELYVVMPPLWEGETASHTDAERAALNQMIDRELEGTRFEGRYINYSEENGLSPYTDFIDVTHLHPEAADRYSAYLNVRIFGEDHP